MVRVRNKRITTYKSISGWKAAMCAEYEDEPGIWTPDVEETGIGAYATREEAEQEALQWAEFEDVPYKP